MYYFNQEIMKHFKLLYFRFTLFFLFWQVFAPLKAQENLILNPSVEEMLAVDTNSFQKFLFDVCPNWWDPYGNAIGNTVDFYSEIYGTIPNCLIGYQNSLNGKNYFGLYLHDRETLFNDTCYFCEMEYAGGLLSQNLVNAKSYRFDFYLSKAEKSTLNSNALDVLMLYDTIVDVKNYQSYGYKIWSEQEPMADTTNWQHVSVCFQANGGEKAFALGNFHEYDSIKITYKAYFDGSNFSALDYRLFDNFSLQEVATCTTIPQSTIVMEELHVQANPSSGNQFTSLEMKIAEGSTGNLSIYDSAGRLLVQKTLQGPSATYTFEGFAYGLYQYHFSTSLGYQSNGKVLVLGE
jgi:hypothetical protein